MRHWQISRWVLHPFIGPIARSTDRTTLQCSRLDIQVVTLSLSSARRRAAETQDSVRSTLTPSATARSPRDRSNVPRARKPKCPHRLPQARDKHAVDHTTADPPSENAYCKFTRWVLWQSRKRNGRKENSWFLYSPLYTARDCAGGPIDFDRRRTRAWRASRGGHCNSSHNYTCNFKTTLQLQIATATATPAATAKANC